MIWKCFVLCFVFVCFVKSTPARLGFHGGVAISVIFLKTYWLFLWICKYGAMFRTHTTCLKNIAIQETMHNLHYTSNLNGKTPICTSNTWVGWKIPETPGEARNNFDIFELWTSTCFWTIEQKRSPPTPQQIAVCAMDLELIYLWLRHTSPRPLVYTIKNRSSFSSFLCLCWFGHLLVFHNQATILEFKCNVTPTCKRFPHSAVCECLKAFFRHDSVLKRTDTLSTNA